MQAAYLQKNGWETADHGVRVQAGSCLGSKWKPASGGRRWAWRAAGEGPAAPHRLEAHGGCRRVAAADVRVTLQCLFPMNKLLCWRSAGLLATRARGEHCAVSLKHFPHRGNSPSHGFSQMSTGLI